MEFHISREIREGLNVDGLIFNYTGNVIFGNVAASRRLASQLNEARGPEADPAKTINAGALFAMGLIDELNHALVAQYRKEIDPAVHSEAIRWFASKLDPAKIEQLLLTFVEQFPNVAIHRGELTPQQWLSGASDGMPNREAALEELMLLWLSNMNPAFVHFRGLFNDENLKTQTVYKNVTEALPDYLATRPPLAEVGSLYEALRAPMLASPDSIAGQLEYIRDRWSKYLSEDLRRILLAIDVLREEDIAIWLRFHPPGPDWHRHGAPTWGTQGFRGDEFVGFDDEFGRKRYAHDYQAPLHEYEAFSTDQAWMPNVVIIAKSTYVWLEQLSKKYGRHIHRLNHIPDEELRILADRGITGLWLIGLWERSVASRTIKRLRGQSDAVASAYSLKEYNIAEDLGGYSAYEDLRNRASHFRIRLASDMVPNHMGIDSPWVIDHPEWFIQRWESPFPVYSFNGPDLSTDSRVELKIEDHYYDQSDAAVAFRLRHHHDGTTRFIYHGNDGTSFAWNDTAQLDYSQAAVREHVIQTILHVARQFPIIRFDAAMVLAKRHVQRLWFPLPGAGGSIPSRAENAMSQEEFDALMPHEFWREVVDRVAAEVPGTLLLAEAFWLLEAYFVRTLGMHRVYNSAFMNMLRDEENAKYRSYIKKTIEFDPDVMKRYVNFMSNPDERTAIDQFGTGDKYFGVCTLLATLPGLPMFGHGQIEGFTERYGMEFKRARMDENPNDWLIERHQREIAPLLKNRRLFAESYNFVLYDFWNDHGTVDENVFAYSNRLGNQRGLIVYNNSYGSTRGTIHISAAYMDKGSGELRQRSLADGLGVSFDDSLIFAYRDTARGLEYLRRAHDFHHHGMFFNLRGFQYAVLLDWRELRPSAEQPWDTLCDALHGEGVHSVDEAVARLRLRPVHDAFHQVVNARFACLFEDIAEKEIRRHIDGGKKPTTPIAPPKSPELQSNGAKQGSVDALLQPFLDQAANFFAKATETMPAEDREALIEQAAGEDIAANFKTDCEALTCATIHLGRLEQSFSSVWPAVVRYMLPNSEPGTNVEQTWSPVIAWIVLRSFSARGMSTDLFDKLLLRSVLAETFSSLGLAGEGAWLAAARVRVLLSHPELPSEEVLTSETFWSDPEVRWLTGVNDSSGTTYFNKEQFEEMVCWTHLPGLIETTQLTKGRQSSLDEIETAVARLCTKAKQAGYKLDTFLASLTAVSKA
jgi:hypothetical protein